MDLRVYYRNIREIEETITEEFPIVISRHTGDGGVAGRVTEVSRGVAAKLLADGLASLASPEQAAEFRERAAEAKRVADQAAAASRMQVRVISAADLRAIKGTRPQK